MAAANETGVVMFGIDIRITPTPNRVDNAVEKAAYKNFKHAAASIRREALASIKPRGKKGKPSPPGQPIRTKSGRGGRLAKRALFFWADDDEAVIGFVASRIDTAMQVHEHGGTRGGATFPARPTMAPALRKNLARFHREWEWAIK